MSAPRSLYVIEAQNGMVKVGSSRNPSARAATILCLSPVPVRLIAQWPGTVKDEFQLHELFGAYRGHSEWFRIEGPVRAFADEIFGRGLAEVQPWFLSTPENRRERARAADLKRKEGAARRRAAPQAGASA